MSESHTMPLIFSSEHDIQSAKGRGRCRRSDIILAYTSPKGQQLLGVRLRFEWIEVAPRYTEDERGLFDYDPLASGSNVEYYIDVLP